MTLTVWWAVLVAAVLAASVFGGVLGFGTGAILLPILSIVLGVRNAVPVLGVAMVVANASRSYFSWKEIDWKVVVAFSSAAVPASIAGAIVFAGWRSHWITVAIAVMVLVLVPLRRVAEKRHLTTHLKHLPWLGGVMGFITGIGGAVGPASAPFFLSYGLVKGSFLGTDGFDFTLIQAVKCIVYGTRGALLPHHLLVGTLLGSLMIVGSFAGRKLVDRLNAESYTITVEVFLVILGILMLVQGLTVR